MHTPVLQKEVLEYLDPKPNENFIDCTIGEGGHAFAILEKIAPRGKILGIDRDKEQIDKLKVSSFPEAEQARYGAGKFQVSGRMILACDTFARLKNIVGQHKFSSVHGVLFDLGMSSWHLEESGRGFSFLRDEPLIMRYDNDSEGIDAADIVNTWPEKDIEIIFREYGEEKFAPQIAKEIIRHRKINPVKTTFQLVEIIKRATPLRHRHGKRIHPATKTFQALRIAVNGELDDLKKALPQTLDVLLPQGRLAVISFHSLEDRIVKNFFQEAAKNKTVKLLTKKAIVPSEEEIERNPRARSAKLRAIVKN